MSFIAVFKTRMVIRIFYAITTEKYNMFSWKQNYNGHRKPDVCSLFTNIWNIVAEYLIVAGNLAHTAILVCFDAKFTIDGKYVIHFRTNVLDNRQ